MTNMVLVKNYELILLILLIFVKNCIADTITYSITLHSIGKQDSVPVLYLEESSQFVINCEPSQVTTLTDLELTEANPNGSMIKFQIEFGGKFMSIRQNGNIVICTGKSKNTGEKMEGKVKLLLPANKPYQILKYKGCNDENYCLNRGQCYKDDQDDYKYCVCAYNFAGPQCQTIFAEGSNILIFVLFIIALIFLCIVGFIFAVCYFFKHKKEAKLRKGMICHLCNKTKCDQNREDGTQTAGGLVVTTTSSHSSQKYSQLKQNDEL